MDDKLTQIYGRGWGFPPTFSLEEGVHMVSGVEDVQQSLRIILSTQLAERIMRPEYGCDLQGFLFSNIREELIAELSVAITDSINRYESRAAVESVDIYQDTQLRNTLLIQVSYRLSGSDTDQQLQGLFDISDGQGVRFI